MKDLEQTALDEMERHIKDAVAGLQLLHEYLKEIDVIIEDTIKDLPTEELKEKHRKDFDCLVTKYSLKVDVL